LDPLQTQHELRQFAREVLHRFPHHSDHLRPAVLEIRLIARATSPAGLAPRADLTQFLSTLDQLLPLLTGAPGPLQPLSWTEFIALPHESVDPFFFATSTPAATDCAKLASQLRAALAAPAAAIIAKPLSDLLDHVEASPPRDRVGGATSHCLWWCCQSRYTPPRPCALCVASPIQATQWKACIDALSVSVSRRT
jgi:hypothetical protein